MFEKEIEDCSTQSEPTRNNDVDPTTVHIFALAYFSKGHATRYFFLFS
jgi:hypothetical protein